MNAHGTAGGEDGEMSLAPQVTLSIAPYESTTTDGRMYVVPRRATD